MRTQSTSRFLLAALSAAVLVLAACGRGETPVPPPGEIAPPPTLPIDPPVLPEVDAPDTAVPEPAPLPAPVTVEEAFTRTVDDVEWGPCPEFMPEGCGLAVLQGDPEDHNADVFFRLAGGTTVANHWHTSAERMVLIAGEMRVDYEGQEPVTLTPGVYAYGPAGLPHETHCVSDEDCILFIAFEEPVDAIAVAEEAAPESPERAFTRTADAVEWGPCPDFMPEGCGLAVLQGDPEARNADVFFRLAPNTTVAYHAHTSAERMVLVAGVMQVDYDGQEPVTLTPGTYAYGPAGLPHVTHCIGDEDCILFIAFEEPVDAFPVEGSP